MEISEEIEYELTTSDDTTYVFSFEEVKTYTNPLDSQIIGIKIQTPFFVRTETSETLADGKVVSHVEHKELSTRVSISIGKTRYRINNNISCSVDSDTEKDADYYIKKFNEIAEAMLLPK